MIIVFDLDGTLIDTADLHAETFVSAFKEEGININFDDARKLIGLSGKKIAERLGSQNPTNLYAKKVEIYLTRFSEVKEIKNATYVLNELKKRGHTICLTTSSNEKMTKIALEKFKWTFDKIITRNSVEHGKPSPDMLILIQKSFKGKIIMIGDSTFDKEMAQNAHIPFLILGENLEELENILNLLDEGLM